VIDEFFWPRPTKDTPLAAIRAYCLGCMGESYDADGNRFSDGLTPGRDCHNKDCPLYPYRTGRRPRRAAAAAKSKPIRYFAK